MSKELIETKALIDDAWVNYALQTIEDNGSSYSYYIHTIAETIEIGGGTYGRQNIYPLELSNTDEEFLISSIERLDSLIDLDFERVYDQSLAASRLYLDSKIEVDGNPLGMVLANGDENQRWFEIILDGSRLNDQSYRRYAYLHEYGHTLGLEHPLMMWMVIVLEAQMHGRAAFTLKIQLWPIGHHFQVNGRMVLCE